MGVADRGASIRIPRQCELDKCGYLEDRRPAANCDPYIVTSMIAKSTLLDEKYVSSSFRQLSRNSTIQKLFDQYESDHESNQDGWNAFDDDNNDDESDDSFKPMKSRPSVQAENIKK